jgi:hypothetical protein
MSGLEVAGVCLGVLPVLLEAVKAYSSLSRSLRIFRHYSSELKLIERQFLVRRGMFQNECCLFLRLLGDDRAAKDMVDNESDDRWFDEGLDAKLGAALQDNIILCRIAIEASKDAIDDLQEELHKFDVFVENKIEVRARAAFFVRPKLKILGRTHQIRYTTPSQCCQNYTRQVQIREKSLKSARP